jgi:2-isopropylmalate synthase
MSDTPRIQIYDTTLRDGTQREGISLSCDDKLRIAARLDDLGVTFIEGGWPGSNPKDAEFFQRARDRDWHTAQLAAFGSTRRIGNAPEQDENLRALLEAETPVCTVVGKSWTLHVAEVLRTTLDQNLEMITDSLAFLSAHGRRVIYDAEHFFELKGQIRSFPPDLAGRHQLSQIGCCAIPTAGLCPGGWHIVGKVGRS